MWLYPGMLEDHLKLAGLLAARNRKNLESCFRLGQVWQPFQVVGKNEGSEAGRLVGAGIQLLLLPKRAREELVSLIPARYLWVRSNGSAGHRLPTPGFERSSEVFVYICLSIQQPFPFFFCLMQYATCFGFYLTACLVIRVISGWQ